MQLNHLDLPVPQTSATKAFFVEHLGFTCVFEREDGLTVLIDEAGFALTLSPLPSGESLKYPTGFHVGFNFQEEAQVVQAHDRLASMGVEIVRPLGQLGGALTFHCNAPGPVLVEFGWRPRD
ncbi:VOC family protein [Ampullimonas aquatilis]|uniref:VOC family protein n=1 Tax=Ampullimonas aquatilis TaxID=1341549 RepID=UPI003C756983